MGRGCMTPRIGISTVRLFELPSEASRTSQSLNPYRCVKYEYRGVPNPEELPLFADEATIELLKIEKPESEQDRTWHFIIPYEVKDKLNSKRSKEKKYYRALLKEALKNLIQEIVINNRQVIKTEQFDMDLRADITIFNLLKKILEKIQNELRDKKQKDKQSRQAKSFEILFESKKDDYDYMHGEEPNDTTKYSWLVIEPISLN